MVQLPKRIKTNSEHVNSMRRAGYENIKQSQLDLINELGKVRGDRALGSHDRVLFTKSVLLFVHFSIPIHHKVHNAHADRK